MCICYKPKDSLFYFLFATFLISYIFTIIVCPEFIFCVCNIILFLFKPKIRTL